MATSDPTDTQFTTLAPHYDELMHMVPYEQWVEYVQLLWSFVDHKPHRVLDCACGTGNVTFGLAHLGLDVIGIDLSQEMIEVARAKREIMSPPLPRQFLQADLTDFHLGETFDSATCLYDSLNYILDPDALQAAFAGIGEHLQPGGVFIFDMNSEHALQADLFTQESRNPARPLHYDWQATYDRDTAICSVRMRFERTLRDGRTETFYETHRERAYSLAEVERKLQTANWALLYTFDAYTLNRPHGRSERWFFVARRV